MIASSEICLVWPFFSQSRALNYDSAFSYLKIVMPGLLEALPEWCFLVLWPRRQADRFAYVADGLFNETDRVLRIPWNFPSSMTDGVRHFDAHHFDQIMRTFSPTVYWMHSVEHAHHMHRGLFSPRANAAIVAQHHFIIHKSLYSSLHVHLNRLLLQMSGTVAADRVVCNSNHTLTMLRESFSQYFNDATMRTIEAKTSVLREGLITDETDIPIKPHARPVFIYNHRFEQYKRPRVTGEVLTQLRFEDNHDFEVWATQSIDQKASLMPVDEIVGHPKRGEYLRRIAVPGINMTHSAHETFCISMLDSIALGHLPIAPNAVTFPELVPDDYPFLFADPSESRAMAHYVLSNFDDVYRKWSPRLREHARTAFGRDAYVTRYAELLQDAAIAHRVHSPKDKTIARLDRCYARLVKGKTVPVVDAFKKSKAIHKNANQAMPQIRFIREMVERGARLRMIARRPHFVK